MRWEGHGVKRKPELGKYLLWNHFRGNSVVRSYLPVTARYSHDTFRTFLRTYGMIYVKPSGGSMGRGILKVWSSDGNIFVHKTVMKRASFTTLKSALKYIDAQREGKPYIVQQGISLAKWQGRPLDIRVMMQRTTPGGEWLYSGMVAKVAGRGSVVTNVALSGGHVLLVETALRESLGWDGRTVRNKVKELIRIATIAAKHFDTYQYYRELGFDMAVDTDGRIWMIEQNTAPSHKLFEKLKGEPAMYRLIESRWSKFAQSQRRLQKKHA